MGKVTLSKVAEVAGVSVGTASRVLSGKATKFRICKDTVNRVNAAARKLSYSPIHIEKTISTHRTNLIGLVIPSLKNYFFAEIASVIISEAERYDYSVMVFDSMETESKFRKSVANLVEKKVEGIIVAPCSDDPIWLEEIDKQFMPVVLIDRVFEETSLSYVTTNNLRGGKDAVQYLIDSGHRKIACIQGIASSTPNIERVKGYTTAMVEAGLEDYINIRGDEYTSRNGYRSTKILLESENPPTAIFTLAGTIMRGSVMAIREAGLRIPDDISMITFDNYSYLDLMEPQIARIQQPIEDVCTLAMKILVQKINNKVEDVSQIRLSPTLITGDSVRRI